MAGGKAGLFGMSSGAILALEADVALPDKVTGVLMYEPPIDPTQSAATAWREHTEMASLAERGEAAAMMVKFLSGVGMSSEALEGFRCSPAWIDYAKVGLTLEHDYRLIAEAVHGDQPPARWQALSAPVFVVNGDASFRS